MMDQSNGKTETRQNTAEGATERRQEIQNNEPAGRNHERTSDNDAAARHTKRTIHKYARTLRCNSGKCENAAKRGIGIRGWVASMGFEPMLTL